MCHLIQLCIFSKSISLNFCICKGKSDSHCDHGHRDGLGGCTLHPGSACNGLPRHYQHTVPVPGVLQRNLGAGPAKPHLPPGVCSALTLHPHAPEARAGCRLLHLFRGVKELQLEKLCPGAPLSPAHQVFHNVAAASDFQRQPNQSPFLR